MVILRRDVGKISFLTENVVYVENTNKSFEVPCVGVFLKDLAAQTICLKATSVS